MRAMKLTVSVAMVAVLAASEAKAQACTGVPTRDRQIALMGDLSMTEGATGYGVAASKNFMGPLSVEAGYTMMSYEGPGSNGNGVDANAAYELKLKKFPRMSVCPTAGISYGWVSDAGAKSSAMIIPVGIGLGRNVIDGAKFDMMVFGVPQFMHVRNHVESDALAIDATTSANEFGGILGARFASAKLFGGASVSFTTMEQSDPVIGVTLGWMIGGRREPVQASRAKAASTKSSGRAAAKPAAKPVAKPAAKPAAKTSSTRKK